jgi:hypothetical protein
MDILYSEKETGIDKHYEKMENKKKKQTLQKTFYKLHKKFLLVISLQISGQMD